MAKLYRIFISHSWAYSNAYDSLKALLDNDPAFNYVDYSVPRGDPIHTNGTDKQLLEAIKAQMSPCNIILMMAGVYSTYSKWINKEIALAAKGFQNPKPIVGVKPWAQTNLSSVVQNAAVQIVGWRKKSIEDAIREHAI